MRDAASFPAGMRAPRSDAAEIHDLPSPFPGPVLLATDGSESAVGATALAAALVHARHARLEVLTVLEPDPREVFAGTLLPEERERLREDERRAEQRLAVRDQLSRCADQIHYPTIDLVVGSPAPVIAHEATQRGASLIVLGLRSHSLLDRVFRDETTLRVMRRASVPVIGVTPYFTELPRRAVVGVDFSVSSLHAARAALPLLADGGTLYLAHVSPREKPVTGDGGVAGETLLVGAIPAGFERFRRLLRARAGIRLEQVVLEGENVHELDEFAGRVGAQLVALGSIRRDDPTPRGGRLREAFVRAATLSVLVGPPGPPEAITED